ncbi:MAG: hypothetical protein NTY66_02345 [Candidatus Vogelbacteria bacterium]|nr:hypothetical protein [Candidatus Vogelbacteria bacterium]
MITTKQLLVALALAAGFIGLIFWADSKTANAPTQATTDYGPKAEVAIAGGKMATGMWRPVIGEPQQIAETDLYQVPFDRFPGNTPDNPNVGWAIISKDSLKQEAGMIDLMVGWKLKPEVSLYCLYPPSGDTQWVATGFRLATNK